MAIVAEDGRMEEIERNGKRNDGQMSPGDVITIGSFHSLFRDNFVKNWILDEKLKSLYKYNDAAE